MHTLGTPYPLLRVDAVAQQLPTGYEQGTHRLVPPEATLARVEPYLAHIQVTRCADVTGLDRPGIPVYCAIRPRGEILQLANGKGSSHLNARASALMEALEHYHAENPDGSLLRRTSFAALTEEGRRVLHPGSLPLYNSDVFYSPHFVMDWVRGENLLSGDEVWMPASAVYVHAPLLYAFSTNGLASGNHPIEATLHSLYEVIERDAIAQLFVYGRLRLAPERCKFLDVHTVDDEVVRPLIDRLEWAQIKLVLIWVKGCVAMNTFWAILLDHNPLNSSTMVHFGWGTHLSLSVAAVRAITEAAQTRLTYIHGARENLATNLRAFSGDLAQKVFAFFDRFQSDTDWHVLNDMASHDLMQDYSNVLTSLREAGFAQVFRVNLTRSPFNIPVTKVFVPGLQMKPGLF